MKRKYTDDDPFVSRSQKKRDMLALQDIGEKLTELAPGHWKNLHNQGVISTDMYEALKDFRTLTSHEAIRRQRQYVGRLMREEDADAVSEAIEEIFEPHRKETSQLHGLEGLRDRLLSEEDALTELCSLAPEADRQRLGQLIRTARKERETGKPPKSFRALFQYLKELDGAEKRLTEPEAWEDEEE